MRVALVNPAWDFTGSIYFGCRAPHLPLELGYARALMVRAGHTAEVFDLHLLGGAADDVAAFRPDMTVVTTAPSYLFWRFPPPELRVPRDFVAALDGRGGRTVAVGPHGSATPGTVRRKLGVDYVIRGECEEAVADLADGRYVPDRLHETRFADLPALSWADAAVARHAHHHHRFDSAPHGPGAEVEASRGCPYACSFCAKLDFRDRYRRRHLPTLLEEIDRLAAQGVTYLYFIDEIFLPWRDLLQALAPRGLAFGVQTRIDLWKPPMLELLGRAGCVSIEAGVESLTEAGRAALAKDCRIDTGALAARLIEAARHVPFVQANLIATPGDDAAEVAAWRDELRAAGVWANDPVPLYPYPGSPDYRARWGIPDDAAWERAHAQYLSDVRRFSDIQETAPLPLAVLENTCPV